MGSRGHAVRVERQNSFQLRGRTATLAGRPDLIVDRGDDALIIDVKSCQEQPWHTVQVMIYQYALPKASARYSYSKLSGEVVYPNHTARVPRGGSTQPVHPGPRGHNPAPSSRHTTRTGAQIPRMSVLRHHRR